MNSLFPDFVLHSLYFLIESQKSGHKAPNSMQVNLVVRVAILVLLLSSDLSVASAKEIDKARILLNEGRSSAALAYLNSLFEGKTKKTLSPKFFEALLLKADAYENLGEFRMTLYNLTIAEKLQPQNSRVHEKLAFTYLRFGDLESALAHGVKAVNLDHTSLVAHSTLALVFESMGKYEKAVEIRSKLLLLQPSDPMEWNNRAKDFECLGDFSKALADRRTALKLATPAQRISMQLLDPLIDYDNLVTNSLKEKIKLQLQKEPVILPFYNLKDHILMRTMLNGAPLDLMVDTGCDISMIWKQVLPNQDPGTAKETADKKEQIKKAFYQAKTFGLGKLIMPKVSFAVEPAHSNQPCFGGFLGSNILSNFVVQIDYVNQKIILTNSLPKLTQNAVIVPMINFDIQPSCKITFDSKLSVVAMIDTGSSCSAAAYSLLEPVLPPKITYTSKVSGQWMGSSACVKVRLKRLQLANKSFISPNFLIFPTSSAPGMASSVLIGNDFLSQFKSVTFDFPQRRIAFEP